MRTSASGGNGEVRSLHRFSRSLTAIAAVHTILAFGAIGRGTLWNIDEGRIAEVSREMAASGDYIVPRIGGIPFASYPPLAYWLMAGAGSMFGFNEFAMRLPSALAGIGLVVLIGLVGLRLAGPAAGLCAALVLSTLGGFYRQEIMCRADILTAFFAVWAFHHFLEIAEGPRRTRDLVAFWAACALGVLAKGPIALVVAGAGALAWLAVRRRWSVIRDLKPLWGLSAFLALTLPWYVAVWRAEGSHFLRVNLMLENADAFVSGYQQRRPLWFYFGQLPLTSFPWILALPAALWARRSPGFVIALLWLAGVFLFFTASSAKRPSYLAYLYPSLALAVGVVLADRFRARPRAFRAAFRGAAVAIGVAAIGACLVPPDRWTVKVEALVDYRWIGLAAILAFAVAVWASSRRPRGAVLATAVGLAVALGVYGMALSPLLDLVGRSSVDFCRRVAARNEPVSVMGPEETEGSFHFYVGAVLPTGNGEPGLYILTEAQRDRLLKAGRGIDVLDQTSDERGRAKMLARVGPGSPP